MPETNNQTKAYEQARQEIEQRYNRRAGMAVKTALAGVIFTWLSVLYPVGSSILNTLGLGPHNEITQKYKQAINDVAILREKQGNYPIPDISRISSKDLAEKARAQIPEVDLERNKALIDLVNEAQARVDKIKSSHDYASSQSFSRRVKNIGLTGYGLGVSVALAAAGYNIRQVSKRIKELENLDAPREVA